MHVKHRAQLLAQSKCGYCTIILASSLGTSSLLHLADQEEGWPNCSPLTNF